MLKEIGGIVNEQPQESKEEQLKATEELQEETIRVVEEKDNKPVTTFKETESVSYTHLTLQTNCVVWVSGVGVGV